MENCIFCKIVSGDIPSTKVYEDADFIAFMDITPESPGHVQVIPKEHHRWVWDVPNINDYFSVAQKIAKAQQKTFNESVLSRVVGEQVPHAHVWLYPDPATTPGDKMDFAGNAARIRAAL